MAIYERRDAREVRVYAGVDPLTGKPHRISRQALDDRTIALLKEHWAGREARAREWGGEWAADAYGFSVDEAGRRPLRVDSMTRRFGELAGKLGHGYTLYGSATSWRASSARWRHYRDHPRTHGTWKPRRDRNLRAPGQ